METAMISVIIYSLWPSPFPRFIVLFFLASQVLQQSEQSKGYQPSSPYSATFCTAAQLPFPRAFYPSLTIHIGIVLNPAQATSRLDYKHLKWLQTHARCTPILFPVSVQVFRTAKHKKIESTFPAIIMSSEKKTLSNVRAGLLVARGLTENRLPAACQVLTDLRMQCHLAFCGCRRGDKGRNMEWKKYQIGCGEWEVLFQGWLEIPVHVPAIAKLAHQFWHIACTIY